MCLQCITKAEYVFKAETPKFLGDYSLMIATETNDGWKEDWDKGQIGFVEMNDPDFVVDWLKIFPDKLHMTYEEISDDDDIASLVYESRFKFNAYIPLGYWITKCAIDEGFDYENQELITWLIHRFHQFYPYIEDVVKELLVIPEQEPEHPITGEKLKPHEIWLREQNEL
jgi:hypothetical protein